MKLMAAGRRAELQHEQAGLQAGEKIKPPMDILGALVASQMDVEAEEKVADGGMGGNIAGLTDKEIIGNICEFVSL
jgi:hypothetical protein